MTSFPKTAPIRLKGLALHMLRLECVTRDKGRCQECRALVCTSPEVPDWHPLKYDMAHLKSRGAGGSDTLDNVRTLCHECHMREHTEGRDAS